MNSVHTDKEIETATKNAIQALYGDGIGDLKIRTLLPFPTEQKREAWDVQLTFLLGGLQYTVDLLINERDGQITNARLIDTMAPL
jgi:hypothetical protein